MNIKIPLFNLDSVRAPLHQARFLPANCYGDDTFFELEKEFVLKKNWLPVGRWDQVEKAGDYFTLDLLDEPLLIIRGQDKVVRALSNVCRHRGAKVLEDAGNTSIL